MDFGQKLKNIRKQSGLSQVELAELLDVHWMTISRWETSVFYPDIRILAEIANLFHVTSDFLIGLSGESGPSGGDGPLQPEEGVR